MTFGLFKRRRRTRDAEVLRYGNAKILNVSVGVYDGGDCARAKVELEICGEDVVLKDVIWIIPNSRIGELKRGQTVSIRFNATRAELV